MKHQFKKSTAFWLGLLVATWCANVAASQGAPAMPGPTGAPKVNPPIVMPPTKPTLGGPVVLGPPTTAPPPVPRGAREAVQGQVVREINPRRALTLRCPPSQQGQFSGFATITGKLQKDSKLVITGDCFGTRPADLAIGLTSGSGFISYFLDDETVRFGWDTLRLLNSSWAQSRIEFRVDYEPDPARQPLVPPQKVYLSLQGRNGINFRAFLTQQDIDTLNSGGTLINPPAS